MYLGQNLFKQVPRVLGSFLFQCSFKISAYQLRPCDSNAEILGILLHLLEGHMHRSDVHVGNVDGHLGDVLLRQPPANSLNCLQSAGLVISPALFSDIQSNPEPNP